MYNNNYCVAITDTEFIISLQKILGMYQQKIMSRYVFYYCTLLAATVHHAKIVWTKRMGLNGCYTSYGLWYVHSYVRVTLYSFTHDIQVTGNPGGFGYKICSTAKLTFANVVANGENPRAKF